MFSMPLFYSSETGGDVDRLAFSQRYDSLLHVLLLADKTFKTLGLALAEQRVDGRDLNAEERLDCSLDFRLRRLLGDIENNLVVFRYQSGLFGNRRRDDHIIVAKIGHLKRSSRASTAALESTSLPRRTMS